MGQMPSVFVDQSFHHPVASFPLRIHHRLQNPFFVTFHLLWAVAGMAFLVMAFYLLHLGPFLGLDNSLTLVELVLAEIYSYSNLVHIDLAGIESHSFAVALGLHTTMALGYFVPAVHSCSFHP